MTRWPMPMERAPIAVTMGDPAGVGPEIALAAFAALARERGGADESGLVLVGSRPLLERAAATLGLGLPMAIAEVEAEGVDPHAIAPGRVAAEAGALAAAAIEEALAGCLEGRYAAMVTAPIHKAAIRAAGISFPGHTEWIAKRSGVDDPVMMLHDARVAVALATIHEALRDVPRVLTRERIVVAGRRLADALSRLSGRAPRLAVLGLNPHAGESGLFGDEEERVIRPAIEELRRAGVDASDPLPADTAFTPEGLERYQGHLAMYHDQGLGPFKALAFGGGVNVTLGLPIVRTSVDHGTAFDIAWQGRADHRSLVAAIRLARRLAGP